MNYKNLPADAYGFRPPSMALGFNTELLRFGIRETVYLDLATEAHATILGSTGSGKSYALLGLLHALSFRKELSIFIADFKGIDFLELQGCLHYYQYMRVGEILSAVYLQLQCRMQQVRTTKL